MTAQVEKPRQERRRSAAFIRKLVASRTEMLTLYSQLAGMKPMANNPDIPPVLEEFCQDLVDYAANAHFQLYRYFAESNERRKEVHDVAQEIYPRIMEITNIILDFNDKYDCGDHCRQLDELEADLSTLGEHLADRIELEDRLITSFGVAGRS